MTPRWFLALLCVPSALTIACENRSAHVEPRPETATSAAPVSESADELERFAQLPMAPRIGALAGRCDGEERPSGHPGAVRRFLTAVLSYAPADAERLAASQGGARSRTQIASARWFPAALRAHPNADGIEVLDGARYEARSYARPPLLGGTLHRISSSNWFVLTLSTS